MKALANLTEREILAVAIATEEEEAGSCRVALRATRPGRTHGLFGSTLAPLFAAASATHSNHTTFLVGLAASLGAGISMGFAKGLSDDGSLTGHGAPLGRRRPGAGAEDRDRRRLTSKHFAPDEAP